ncbi:hypothetical protein [Streptomyces sp. NPDC005322]|uniref:hypothetical protein n=1 Tax=unclassified Streptomyces TaxID=2593676 RepID=UPI00339E1C98
MFDSAEPPEGLPPERRAAHEARAAWVAEAGESFLSCFTPEELAKELRRLGFSEIEDIRYGALPARYEGERREADGAAQSREPSRSADGGSDVIHTWLQRGGYAPRGVRPGPHDGRDLSTTSVEFGVL